MEEGALSIPSTSHWYVTDLSLSLHFHSHNSVIVATLVIFFAILIILLLIHFTDRYWDLPVEVDRSKVEVLKKGLDAATTSSLPTFLTSRSSGEYSICLVVFKENDEGKVVLTCNPVCHLECLDIWLNSHGSCPLCRSTIDEIRLSSI